MPFGLELRRDRRFLPMLFFAGLAGAVYINALHNPFVYDDYRTILENGSIRALTDWRSIVLHEVTRPVANLSYAIDYAIWGPAPFGFHVTSVMLHVLNVLLLFAIAQRLIEDRYRNPRTTDSSAG